MSPLSICFLVFAFFGKTFAEDDFEGPNADETVVKMDPEQQRKLAPIFQAVQESDIEEIKELLDSGEDINQREKESGQTPLMFSVLNGKIKAAEFLLSEGADSSIPELSGYTPFHATGFTGRYQMVPILIKYGLDPNDRHKDGFQAIHRACWGFQENHAKTVQALIDAGVDPNSKAYDGDTPVSGQTPIEMTTNAKTKKILEKAIKEWNKKEAAKGL